MPFSPSMDLVFPFALIEARYGGHPEMQPDHLFIALARLAEFTEQDFRRPLCVQMGSAACEAAAREVPVLNRWFVDRDMEPTYVRRLARCAVGMGPDLTRAPMRFSGLTESALRVARGLVGPTADPTVSALHVLLGVTLRPTDTLARVLRTQGNDRKEFRPSGPLLHLVVGRRPQAAELYAQVFEHVQADPVKEYRGLPAGLLACLKRELLIGQARFQVHLDFPNDDPVRSFFAAALLAHDIDFYREETGKR